MGRLSKQQQGKLENAGTQQEKVARGRQNECQGGGVFGFLGGYLDSGGGYLHFRGGYLRVFGGIWGYLPLGGVSNIPFYQV